MLYVYPEIRSVHLELTERCNAACPQCPRRIDGGILNPNLTMAELSLTDVQLLLPPEFLGQLNKVYFCGNYGDPAAAADTLSIAAYLRSASPHLKIGIHTNGGIRPHGWWQCLAETIGGHGYVRFAIDGLEDTNHIYRRNTDWQKIMANAASVIETGCSAEWDYLVFAHNEHQVETARELARTMGFAAFNVKRSNRFLQRKTMAYAASHVVRDRHGAAVATVERPHARFYQNETLLSLEANRSGHASYDAYLATRDVACKAAREKSIYISAEGKIFPCCYLAQMVKNLPSEETQDFQYFMEESGTDIPAGPVGEAMAHILFSSTTPRRLKVCARVCGT